MSHRILVVDDNEDVVHITASFLTAKGYTVETPSTDSAHSR